MYYTLCRHIMYYISYIRGVVGGVLGLLWTRCSLYWSKPGRVIDVCPWLGRRVLVQSHLLSCFYILALGQGTAVASFEIHIQVYIHDAVSFSLSDI